MKNGAKLFYLIGFIFNIIALFVLALFIALFALVYSSPDFIQKFASDTGSTIELIKEVFLVLIILFSVSFVIELVIIFFCANARKNLDRKSGKVSPHVVLLILGIVGVNLFYLLGSIFGMTAASNDNDEEDE